MGSSHSQPPLKPPEKKTWFGFFEKFQDSIMNSITKQVHRELFYYVGIHIKFHKWRFINERHIDQGFSKIEREMKKRNASRSDLNLLEDMKEYFLYPDGQLAKHLFTFDDDLEPVPFMYCERKPTAAQSKIFKTDPQILSQETLSRQEITEMRNFFQGMRDNELEQCTDQEKSVIEPILQYLRWLSYRRNDQHLHSIYESYRRARTDVWGIKDAKRYKRCLHWDCEKVRDRLEEAGGGFIQEELVHIIQKFLERGQLPPMAYIPEPYGLKERIDSPENAETINQDTSVSSPESQTLSITPESSAQDIGLEAFRNLGLDQMNAHVEGLLGFYEPRFNIPSDELWSCERYEAENSVESSRDRSVSLIRDAEKRLQELHKHLRKTETVIAKIGIVREERGKAR